MGLKRSTILKSILATIVLVLVVIMLGFVSINLAFVKGHIEQYARENLDLDVKFQGPLRLRLGASPRVEAAAIEIRKIGAVDEVLIRVAALSVNPQLIEIMQGRMHVKSLVLTDIEFDYCAALPSFGNGKGSTEPLPSIAAKTLLVTNLQLFCENRENEQTLHIAVAELNGSAPADEGMSATVRGRVDDLLVDIQAHSSSLNAILAQPETLPLRLKVTAPGAEFRLEGAITDLFGRLELRADTNFQVQNPQSLLSNLGVSIPDVAGFEFAGRTRLNLDAVGIENLVGRLGNSNVEGRALARFSSERNYYEVDAHLGQLHPDLFGSASDVSEENEDPQAFDLRPLLDALRGFDGKIHLTADRLTTTAVNADDLVLDANLSDGNLLLSRYRMLFLGGQVEIEAGLDMQGECAEFRARGRATGVDLQLLAELLDEDREIVGNVGRIDFESQSCGNTLTELRNTVQADVDVSDATIGLENLASPMRLDSLKASAGWSRPSRAVLHGQLLDEKFSVDAHGGTMEKLATGAPWPITLAIAGPNSSISLDGNAAIGTDSLFVNMQLNVDAPRVGLLHRWFDVDPTSELPLSVSASIESANGNILIDELDAALGRSHIKGKLESSDGDTEPVLVADLTSQALDIIELRSALLPSEEANHSSIQSDQESDDFDTLEFVLGLDLPSVDLNLRIERFDGTSFEIRDVELQGSVRSRFIDNANLRVTLDDIPLEGDFNLDLRNLPAEVSYQVTATDLNIGQLLQQSGLIDDMAITAETLTLDHSSHGSTMREFVINGETLVDIRNLNWLAEQQGEDTVSDLFLDRLVMSSAPDRPTEWEASGLLNGIPVNAWASTPQMGDILHGVKTSPLTVVASSGNDVAMLSGNVDWSNADVFSGNLVLSGERMDPEAVDFAELKSPLKGFDLRTNLTISDREVSFADLRVHTGASHATGHAKVNFSEDIKEFEVRLQAPHVQTDDFVAAVDEWRDLAQENAEADLLSEPGTRVLEDVVHEYIEALTLENSFDVRIGIDALYAGNEYLGGAQLGVLADTNNFRLQPIKVTVPSGDIDAEYVVARTASGVETVLNIYVERLEYGDLLRLLDPGVDQEARGYIYLDTSLTSKTPTTRKPASAMEGEFELMIIPANVLAGALDLWATNLVIAVLPTPADRENRKKLNCMVANFSVDDGVMKSNTVLLDTTQVIVRGRGDIDVASQTLDMMVAPQAKREKFFSMSTPITITGSWDDFQVGVTKGGAMATVFRLYMALIYVPYKWVTGERFPADGLATCFNATRWDMPTEPE
jgi:uncharacterized protein involved in outer membrane biogenesis